MPGYLVDDTRKVTTHRLKEMKAEGKKIAMLTSYDFTTAKIVDEAGVDMILIGDSASNVMAGIMPDRWRVRENVRSRGAACLSAPIRLTKRKPCETPYA